MLTWRRVHRAIPSNPPMIRWLYLTSMWKQQVPGSVPLARQQRVLSRSLWQTLAVVFCVGFGCSHLLNVFTSGDGLWYWYTVLFDRGQRLYADLHLNLQPLFILTTWVFLHVFGHSWLGFRVFPLFQVVLYSVGLMLVARFAPWTDAGRAWLILAAFGVTFTIFYYRFDDFHVTTQILQVYSIWLMLLLARRPTRRRALISAVLLGLLAGLSVANRLNDGAALFAASLLGLFALALGRRLVAAAIFCTSAIIAFMSVILLTGDHFSDWYRYTVVEAAKIKGGSSHILLYPITLPLRIVQQFARDPHKLLLATYPACTALCIAAVPWIVRTQRGVKRVLLLCAVATALTIALPHYWKGVYQGASIPVLANLAVPLAYLLLLLITVQGVRHLRHPATVRWDSNFVLLAVPLFQLFLAAVTGGAGIVESAPAMALTLLLLPVLLGRHLPAVARDSFVALLAVLSVSAFADKFLFPFNWHHFYSDTMFQNRAWYHHPVYGPMYVDTRQLRFIQPICADISKHPGTGLLSLPYPHANYFCNIPPWHGYVQTWYDTSSRATIGTLVHELETAPPTWILYERSVPTMMAHEIVYTNHQPLPHRALDALIVSRIESLQWTVSRQQCFGGADWMLIRTSPPRTGENAPFPVLMGNWYNLCGFTQFTIR